MSLMLRSCFVALGLTLAQLSSAYTQEGAKELQAAEFGLDAKAADNTEALRKALAACVTTPGSKLVIAPGTYRFDTAKFGQDKVLALVENAENLVIDGGGSQFLLVGDPRGVTGLRFLGCKGVRIQNLKVDCEKLPFAQGKFVSFDGEKMVIDLDPKFPLQPDLNIESIVDCDPETGVMLANIDLYSKAISSVEKEGEHRIIVHVKLTVDTGNQERLDDLKKMPALLPGKTALIRQATYGSFMFTFLESSDVVMEDVTVYCFAGMAIHAQGTKNITIRRFVAAPPENSGRLLSITKDGIHLTHVAGEILLEDSRFDMIGDDAFNTYAKYRTLSKVVDSKQIEMIFPVVGWRGPTPTPGEVLNFWDAKTMDWKGKAQVAHATWNAGAKNFKVTFRDPLPENLGPKDYISSEKFIHKVIVRRCEFRGMLARALVFSTYDILVEDNKIFSTSYSGMLFMAGLRHGGQGPAPRNVTIRRNVIHGTGGTAIYAYAFAPRAGRDAMKNFTIEENKISTDERLDAMRLKTRRPDWMHWSAGLCFLNASDIKVRKNEFTGYSIPLYMENVEGVDVSGNVSAAASQAVINKGAGEVVFENNQNITLERDAREIDGDLHYIGILR